MSVKEPTSYEQETKNDLFGLADWLHSFTSLARTKNGSETPPSSEALEQALSHFIESVLKTAQHMEGEKFFDSKQFEGFLKSFHEKLSSQEGQSQLPIEDLLKVFSSLMASLKPMKES